MVKSRGIEKKLTFYLAMLQYVNNCSDEVTMIDFFYKRMVKKKMKELTEEIDSVLNNLFKQTKGEEPDQFTNLHNVIAEKMEEAYNIYNEVYEQEQVDKNQLKLQFDEK